MCCRDFDFIIILVNWVSTCIYLSERFHLMNVCFPGESDTLQFTTAYWNYLLSMALPGNNSIQLSFHPLPNATRHMVQVCETTTQLTKQSRYQCSKFRTLRKVNILLSFYLLLKNQIQFNSCSNVLSVISFDKRQVFLSCNLKCRY